MLTATHGVGYLLLDGRENFRMDQVILGVFVVGLIGFAMHGVADLAEKRLIGWRGSSLAQPGPGPIGPGCSPSNFALSQT
jgi:sulfonate transport system permease protein